MVIDIAELSFDQKDMKYISIPMDDERIIIIVITKNHQTRNIRRNKRR